MKIAFLHCLVLRQPCLKLPLFLFLGLNQCLRAGEGGSGLIASFVELHELRIECAYLSLDRADFQIILLQCQQRFNFLLHLFSV